ncbi:hypothetical protein PAECIP111890_01063 [Paenibacillus sp. JJ-223]|nr:hypothetical protein PAECIP111890_01063 [Paenibacillus sp. JJ-223]
MMGKMLCKRIHLRQNYNVVIINIQHKFLYVSYLIMRYSIWFIYKFVRNFKRCNL